MLKQLIIIINYNFANGFKLVFCLTSTTGAIILFSCHWQASKSLPQCCEIIQEMTSSYSSVTPTSHVVYFHTFILYSVFFSPNDLRREPWLISTPVSSSGVCVLCGRTHWGTRFCLIRDARQWDRLLFYFSDGRLSVAGSFSIFGLCFFFRTMLPADYLNPKVEHKKAATLSNRVQLCFM